MLFALLINGSLTKDGIKKTLTTWGIPFGSWFNGGNFKSRLVDANLIKVDGKNENGETIYSLTARGTQKARKRLEGLKKKDKK